MQPMPQLLHVAAAMVEQQTEQTASCTHTKDIALAQVKLTASHPAAAAGAPTETETDFSKATAEDITAACSNVAAGYSSPRIAAVRRPRVAVHQAEPVMMHGKAGAKRSNAASQCCSNDGSQFLQGSSAVMQLAKRQKSNVITVRQVTCSADIPNRPYHQRKPSSHM